jgi:DNA-directed RNA polymerase subunit RPC12/RpoP
VEDLRLSVCPRTSDADEYYRCPRCGQELEFHESHRLIGEVPLDASGLPSRIGPHAPAWACRTAACGYRRLVRRAGGDVASAATSR